MAGAIRKVVGVRMAEDQNQGRQDSPPKRPIAPWMWVVGPFLGLGIVWAMMEEIANIRSMEAHGGGAYVWVWSGFFYDLAGIPGVVFVHVVFITLVLLSSGILGWRGFKPRETCKRDVGNGKM